MADLGWTRLRLLILVLACIPELTIYLRVADQNIIKYPTALSVIVAFYVWKQENILITYRMSNAPVQCHRMILGLQLKYLGDQKL